VGFEYFVKVTKSPTRVTGHRTVFTSTVTHLLYLPIRLALLYVIRFLVLALIVVYHP
jgi:hypothetical protein